MQAVLLVIHLMLAVALVGVVLLQRSEGGALGIGGGGGMAGLMTGRSTANLLTRTTAVLAACFMLTSLTLAWLASGEREPTSILEQPPVAAEPAVPVAPAEPQVPLAE
jgi:preprotein translocase subunit SecG